VTGHDWQLGDGAISPLLPDVPIGHRRSAVAPSPRDEANDHQGKDDHARRDKQQNRPPHVFPFLGFTAWPGRRPLR